MHVRRNICLLKGTVLPVPKVAVDDVQLLALLFDNVVNEPPNVRAYVQDALSSMIEIYTKVPENTPFYGELQEIILNAVQKVKSFYHCSQ